LINIPVTIGIQKIIKGEYCKKKKKKKLIAPMDRGTKTGCNMVHTYGEHASFHASSIRSFDCVSVCVSAMGGEG
jgi:hypothetical protein